MQKTKFQSDAVAYLRIVHLLKNGPLDTGCIVQVLPFKYSTTCRYLSSLMEYDVTKIKKTGKNGRRIYELAENWQRELISVPSVQDLQTLFKLYCEVFQGEA